MREPRCLGPITLEVEGEAVAARTASERRIDLTETGDASILDGAPGDLVGGVPVIRIPHSQNRKGSRIRFPAIAPQAGDFFQVLFQFPRAVISLYFDAHESGARTDDLRSCADGPSIPVLSDIELEEWTGERSEKAELRTSGTAEIPQLRMKDPLSVLDMMHQLRHDEVEIGVALAVPVRG